MSTTALAVATQNQNNPASKTGRYLTFSLGNESYGIPVLNVREIIRLCPITPVPKMPTHIKGVINLRGTVIAVLDLRAKFQLSQADYNDRACIIVVQLLGANGVKTNMGAIVDAVEEVVHLNEAAIEPAPDFGGSPNSEYILGVTTAEGGVKTLLDIEKIFLDDASITRSLPEGAPKLTDSPSASVKTTLEFEEFKEFLNTHGRKEDVFQNLLGWVRSMNGPGPLADDFSMIRVHFS